MPTMIKMAIVPTNNIGTKISANIPFMEVCIFSLLPRSRLVLPVTECFVEGGLYLLLIVSNPSNVINSSLPQPAFAASALTGE